MCSVPEPTKEFQRLTLPQKRKHEVFLRDGGRCRWQDENGQRCCKSRWIEIHHIKPLSQGGNDDLENLLSLCSAHHKISHLQDWP